jgi:hypothetical protein
LNEPHHKTPKEGRPPQRHQLFPLALHALSLRRRVLSARRPDEVTCVPLAHAPATCHARCRGQPFEDTGGKRVGRRGGRGKGIQAGQKS